ncbi:MAG: VWA domain-containing protein [Vicinamibacterales bacterium]
MPALPFGSGSAYAPKLFAALLALTLVGGLAAVSGWQNQPARFRSGVDVIAVDVQVVDDDGNPIDSLGPNLFEVSINGKRRKVASAQFVRHAWQAPPRAESESPPPSSPVSAAAPIEVVPGGGRTFIMAIDNGSFDVGAGREAVEAVQGFVDRLQQQDRVGVYVYPTGIWIEPTTLRAPVRVQLERVIGERQPLRSYYNLTASEIVDITAQSTNPHSFLTAVRAGNDPATEQLDVVRTIQRRECQSDPNCLARIYAEGIQLAVQLENQTQASLNGLAELLQRLADMPGRKAVVIVSAGVLVSDRLDGRPDIGNQARILGQTAARANATVYTLHIDMSTRETGTAKNRGAGSSEHGRERAMYGVFLDQFSSAAGGERIYVPVGGGGFALDRVLKESSAYYLLGVEPADADRDGTPRELKVKVNRRGVTVRNRQWVLVPTRDR